jgi:hypothetical protein
MSISTPKDLTGNPTFIYVVDGEVAEIQVLEPIPFNERRISYLSSDPKIYVLPGGYPANPNTLPKPGSTYAPE